MTDPKATAKRALALLDLTNLDETCQAGDVMRLCAAARTAHGPVAAICLYPRWVPFARAILKSSPVRIATVANFPKGGVDAIEAVKQTVRAFEEGADEVDVVMPWRSFLAGDEQAPRNVIAACRAVTPARGVLKVILETGELKSDKNILRAAQLAIDEGADFLKTSTGKAPVNATSEAAELLLGAIEASGRPVGFKASGGIKTTADAARYLEIADRVMGPGWATPKTFRFGASSLLAELLASLDDGTAAPSGGY